MLYGILLAWSLWSPQRAASNIDLQKKDYLENLAITIAECIERKDTDHSIFHGCIDWHSAVHGHWALLRLYRATGDSTWLHLVEDSIDDQMLVLERSLLREHPRFEMPYGRAWFLLLTRLPNRLVMLHRLFWDAENISLLCSVAFATCAYAITPLL